MMFATGYSRLLLSLLVVSIDTILLPSTGTALVHRPGQSLSAQANVHEPCVRVLAAGCMNAYLRQLGASMPVQGQNTTLPPQQLLTGHFWYRNTRSTYQCSSAQNAFIIERELCLHHREQQVNGPLAQHSGHYYIAMPFFVVESGAQRCLVSPDIGTMDLVGYGHMLRASVHNEEEREQLYSQVMFQLVYALNYIHRLTWTHNGLRADNVMVHLIDQDIRRPRLQMRVLPTYRQLQGEVVVPPTLYQASDIGYLPPEFARGGTVDLVKVDVWQMAMTIGAMVDGVSPYAHKISGAEFRDVAAYLTYMHAHYLQREQQPFGLFSTEEFGRLVWLKHTILRPLRGALWLDDKVRKTTTEIIWNFHAPEAFDD